jgi:hypothetical protein
MSDRELILNVGAVPRGWGEAKGAFPALRTLVILDELGEGDGMFHLDELAGSLEGGALCCPTLDFVWLGIPRHQLEWLERLVAALGGLPALSAARLRGKLLDGREWVLEGSKQDLAVLGGRLAGLGHQRDVRARRHAVLHPLETEYLDEGGEEDDDEEEEGHEDDEDGEEDDEDGEEDV